MSEFLPENHKLALISFSTEAGRIKGRNKVRFILLSIYYQFCQILSTLTEHLKFGTSFPVELKNPASHLKIDTM